MENLNFCEECEARQVTCRIPISKEKTLGLCLVCYEEKARNNELPSEKELGLEFFQDALDSLPPERSNKNSQGKTTSGNQMVAVNHRNTPTLDSIGKDITGQAKNGLLDPVIGRGKEIEKTIRTLSRRMKNNPVFVGEPGVGKTAVVEGLAQRIISGDVPKSLEGKHIISLNVASIVAGTKYRGEFEDRLIKIIDELRKNKNVILFIDELHTIIGAGGAEGAVDASNIIKPALSRGEMQVIGATTYEEYRKYIEKDAALERRFTKIQVEEPTVEESYEILQGLKSKYEEHHNINIQDEAIKLAVDLSHKYINDRFLPDKALDVLDEACSLKAMGLNNQDEIQNLEKKLESAAKTKEKISLTQDFEKTKKARREEQRIKDQIQSNRIVENEDILFIVSEWTNIPLQSLKEDEKEKLKNLEKELKASVIGQDGAVEVIAKSIRRSRVGLKDPKRPQGTYLLVGPTGVGKTELARTVARTIYGSEDKIIPIDMSEYMEKHSVAKLIGSPPGYVGHDDEGKLIKYLRRNPYSLVLFDEIEKAHPDVFNVMLQIFEEGRLTDGKGRTTDAKNATFLLTSNAGSEVFSNQKSSLGFAESDERKSKKEQIMAIVKKKFKPEFLNRLDDILVFNQLTEEDMIAIAEKHLDEFAQLVSEQHKKIKYDEEVVKHLAKVGYDKEYGARSLKRKINEIKDLLADKILEKEKDNYTISIKENKIHIK